MGQLEINPMTETEDLAIIVQAIDEARRLLRAHVELSADAAITVERLDELIADETFNQAVDRTRLRSLRQSLALSEDPSTRT